MNLGRLKQRISQTGVAAYDRLRYRINEKESYEAVCRFVSSNGIKKSCLYWGSDGYPPEVADVKRRDVEGSSNPISIYVRANRLAEFAERALDQIECRFVLVTGDCDDEVGARDMDASLRARILEHPLLDAWFAQNCNDKNRKLHPLPIGMDYHTLTFQLRHRPWGFFANPRVQELMLDDARIIAPELENKKIAGYCNWHHAINRGDRLDCINGVQLETIFLEQPDANRTQSWQNNAGFFFTISPLGCGLDCHRTWEALLLGSVPIVPRSGINSLFSNLPVCIVDDWREVTVDYLKTKRSWVLENEFDFAPLYLDWWKARLRGETELPRRIRTFQEFINTAHEPLTAASQRRLSAV